MDSSSVVSVVVGAVAFFALGALWYSALFRRPWMQDMGLVAEVEQEPQAPGAGLLAGSFVVALVLAAVIESFAGDCGPWWGLRSGAWVGLAIAAVMGQVALYDSRPTRLWVIHAGYAFVGSVLVGLIVGIL